MTAKGGTHYKGYRRIRTLVKSDGCSTEPLCEVPCGGCGDQLHRSATSIRKAEKRGTPCLCWGCQQKKCQAARVEKKTEDREEVES